VFEPVIAIAASPRDWAPRLRRHIADHGGARMRAIVLYQEDALDESFEVFIVDDTTSFLTPQLVMQLHDRGRQVLGVYEDAMGKRQLVSLGVDQAIERAASTEELLVAVSKLAANATPHTGEEVAGAPPTTTQPTPKESAANEAKSSAPASRGHLIAVGGAVGGCGTTEIAISLAVALGKRGGRVVLVDGDEVTPSIAPCLGLAGSPNLRAAVDALARGTGQLEAALIRTHWSPVRVLPGATSLAVRSADVAAVVRHLASWNDHVVVDVGRLVGQCHSDHTLVERADTVVAVGLPTPVGVGRLLDFLARATTFAPSTPVHLVLNQIPRKGARVAHRLGRCWSAASLTTIPFDRRVQISAWAAQPVAAGQFVRAVDMLATRLVSRQEKP
jgi:MinD-like ATPase involved in chromosome partitioning or flagellar assembly